MNETLKIISERKSVRKFTDKKIEKEKVEQLVKAGMSAPSARNKQPWDFIVIDNEKILHELGEKLPYAKMLLHSKLAIVVCGNINKSPEDEEKKYWVQDCSAATENILLAAQALGLGAVWTAAYPVLERVKTVCEVLNLPNKVIPLNVIPIGYPDEDNSPKNKFLQSNVHYNKW